MRGREGSRGRERPHALRTENELLTNHNVYAPLWAAASTMSMADDYIWGRGEDNSQQEAARSCAENSRKKGTCWKVCSCCLAFRHVSA
jgi:hypothetical protein